ncbi:transcription initiation factor TFIID subunit 7 [Galendromus occidentalis]|uniref:Transcription initiation factor TFIID subunit 7 n=1 Tax=Galendromus occidentalis TaxID=34638 RepID=A0AAJ7SHU1_9ACAR|nr:transcription initiation factor TFIID subunit 7 [Galendromus occidentalis]
MNSGPTTDFKNRPEAVFELESQFVLRVPSWVSGELREAVRQGNSNLKDRLAIKLESDNRVGSVRFDSWNLPSRVYDLPSVIESHKTLDRKTFYKTADISQIMICYEPGQEPKSDDEAPLRKRKDALTKKYLYPHGITPPLKNVRKRRFRKTLKKKYIDFPEIEKEVKRLFREDNEAESVRYEVIRTEDEMKADGKGAIEVTNHPGPDHQGPSGHSDQTMDVGEHDLFGEPLSSSDEEGEQLNINVDSTDDSRSPLKKTKSSDVKDLVTQFSHASEFSDMLNENLGEESNMSAPGPSNLERGYEEEAEAARALECDFPKDDEVSQNTAYHERLAELDRDMIRLTEQRRQQEAEIANIENMALRQRFQSLLQNIKLEQAEKQREYDNIVQLLHQ